MRIKVGGHYLARQTDPEARTPDGDNYWEFIIVWARDKLDKLYFLGVKPRMWPSDDLGEHPQAWWFDEGGLSLDGNFQIYSKSRGKITGEGRFVDTLKYTYFLEGEKNTRIVKSAFMTESEIDDHRKFYSDVMKKNREKHKKRVR